VGKSFGIAIHFGRQWRQVFSLAGYGTMSDGVPTDRPAPDSGSALHTRPSLLLRLRDPADAKAWTTFVDVYGPLVYNHARRRGLRHEDAEDVTQKVFARVSGAIRAFDYQPDIGRFRDWLGTVVRNEVNRFLAKENKSIRATGELGDANVFDKCAAPAADTEWAAEFHAHVLQVALTRCRPRFEEPTWRAFERVWLEHRSAAEVAREFGQPIDWVYTAKSRVLKQLWQEVEELADDAALVVTVFR
jgi:RNA polymerase sigma-70 factor (ECF subfamily)